MGFMVFGVFSSFCAGNRSLLGLFIVSFRILIYFMLIVISVSANLMADSSDLLSI